MMIKRIIEILEYGFRKQCHPTTGDCICQAGTYSLASACVPCECGYGSLSSICAPDSGQCACSGEAVGRRCDRCIQKREVLAKNAVLLLDRKSLKCVPVRDRCPSNIEDGVQWPTTSRGTTARQSCPAFQLGIATRKCSPKSEWMVVNSYNCTLPQVYDLQNKIEQSDSFSPLEVSRKLVNISSHFHYMAGRNFDILLDTFNILVQKQSTSNGSTAEHTQDMRFTRNLLKFADRLLTVRQQKMPIVEEHKTASAKQISTVIQFVGEKMVFAIDRLNTHNYPYAYFLMPKFDHFAAPKAGGSYQFQLQSPSPSLSTVFYMAVEQPLVCRQCLNPIVAIHQVVEQDNNSTLQPVQLVLKLNEESGWKFPECVHLTVNHDMELKKNRYWQADGAVLLAEAFNSDHLKSNSSFNPSDSCFRAMIHFSLASLDEAPYITPLCALFALLLCIFSLYSALFRHGIRTRFIRCSLICVFVVNAASLIAVQKVNIGVIFCPVRNAILAFTVSALFAWLFLYSLHIYRILAEGKVKSCFTLSFLLGVLVPSILSLAEFLLTVDCTLRYTSQQFWLLFPQTIRLCALQFAIRRSLANHSILVFLCAIYNTICILELINGEKILVYKWGPVFSSFLCRCTFSYGLIFCPLKR
uniref:G-protein coupled receptors family 2 profile 1 domain-containing protein n=1 Tax=Ditylenchus dipsaci TaxID=166011 RepID=A0A915CQB9_9BILA